MSEALVGAAVSWWARRVGPRVVFDRDDACQEARIAVWQAQQSGRGAHAYRRILDAMRRAIPGFKQHEAPAFVSQSQAPEAWHDDTPDKALEVLQRVRRMDKLPEPERSIAVQVLQGRTVTQIAADRGVSASAISHRLRVAHRYICKA